MTVENKRVFNKQVVLVDESCILGHIFSGPSMKHWWVKIGQSFVMDQSDHSMILTKKIEVSNFGE